MQKILLLKKIFVLKLLLILICVNIIPSFSGDFIKESSYQESRTIFYVGGSGPGNYTTIQSAIDVANNGDTVYVYSGLYPENVLIDKSINLFGENKEMTIINGSIDINNYYYWLNLCNLTIRDSYDGIYIGNGSSYVNIENCILKNCENGIYSHRNKYLNISKCTMINNSNYGIYVIDMFNDPDYINISECIFQNNGNGLLLYGSSLTNIIDSIILNSTNNGIFMKGLCDPYGMCYSDCSYNMIKNCNISGNIEGIYISGESFYGEFNYANYNTITECTLTDNQYGIHINYLTHDNIIYKNNLINNTENAFDADINWYNSSNQMGNYWDDYTGEDLNGDGIGDTPYNISGGSNQDLYPFMNQSGWIQNFPPYVPYNPDPYDGEKNVDINHDLSWFGGDPNSGDIVTYDVFFGLSYPPLQATWNQTILLFDPGTMFYNETYYWKIISWDNHGLSTSGPIWQFTTHNPNNQQPFQPIEPIPIDGASDIELNPMLSVLVIDPDGDEMDISFYNASDDSLIATDYGVLSGTRAYVKWSNLSGGYTYYWYAIADDGQYQIHSDTWQFTTINPQNISDLDCSGDLDWTDVQPGATVYGSITVYNIGEPGSLLDWEIKSYPEWGIWVFDPDNGTDLLQGESSIISVEVIAPDIQKETFSGEIEIVNGDDFNDTCIIDVSLSTPTILQLVINQLFHGIFTLFNNIFSLFKLVFRLPF